MKTYSFYQFAVLLLILCHSTVTLAQNLDDELVVNATISDVEGNSPKAVTEANKMADIFVLQKQLVYELLQNIGIKPDRLSPAVKAAIDRPQTTSLEAFNAFSNCLDLMDKKLYGRAREQCNAAISIDPNFAYAQKLLETIPNQNQTMQEIVADHMGKLSTQSESFMVNNLMGDLSDSIKSDASAVQIADLRNSQAGCQGGNLECQVTDPERSTPACDNNGHCGFYATFLAQDDSSVSSAPMMNRVAVSIPSTNSTGAISINQIGYESKGLLNVQLDPNQQGPKIISFQNGQTGQGNDAVSGGQLERLALTRDNQITGLTLGVYFPSNYANGLGYPGSVQANALINNFLYFAEGQVTPSDTLRNLGRVTYNGLVYGDFSVNGALVPCQGNCGNFTSTLNYGAAKLENFDLQANASQAQKFEVSNPQSDLTAVAHIQATNIDLKPTGEFQFDQSSANSSFQAGNNTLLNPSEGVVAARPFGSNGEALGGVFSIHNNSIQGVGSFGGMR